MTEDLKKKLGMSDTIKVPENTLKLGKKQSILKRNSSMKLSRLSSKISRQMWWVER